MTPYTLGAILAALACDPDDPPDTMMVDLATLCGTPVPELKARIKRIRDEDQEDSSLPFY